MEEKNTCFICEYPDIKFYFLDTGDGYRIICPVCGEYTISGTLASMDRDEYANNAYILSGIVREYKEMGIRFPMLDSRNIKELPFKYPAPDIDNIEEKVKKFILRIREKSKNFGAHVEIWYHKDYSLAYAKNAEEFVAIIKLVQDESLIEIMAPSNAGAVLSLTAAGWNLTNSLKSTNQNSEQGFVAIWFDSSMKESINAIEESISEAGFKSMCILDEHFSERIMDKALGEIRKSRFIVVDLTGARGSVFFEAGFAFGLGVEAIYVYKIGETTEALEFYVRHYQCYSYENPVDLKEKLKNAISARIPKKN